MLWGKGSRSGRSWRGRRSHSHSHVPEGGITEQPREGRSLTQLSASQASCLAAQRRERLTHRTQWEGTQGCSFWDGTHLVPSPLRAASPPPPLPPHSGARPQDMLCRFTDTHCSQSSSGKGDSSVKLRTSQFQLEAPTALLGHRPLSLGEKFISDPQRSRASSCPDTAQDGACGPATRGGEADPPSSRRAQDQGPSGTERAGGRPRPGPGGW